MLLIIILLFFLIGGLLLGFFTNKCLRNKSIELVSTKLNNEKSDKQEEMIKYLKIVNKE